MDDTNTLRIERRDLAKNMLRFYALQVTSNLFGEWCLLRVWGRIGRRGQMRTEYFWTQDEAQDALWEAENRKRKCGYLAKQQKTSASGGEECQLSW